MGLVVAVVGAPEGEVGVCRLRVARIGVRIVGWLDWCVCVGGFCGSVCG